MNILSKILDFFKLIVLNLRVQICSLIEFIRVACAYYSNFRFFKIDLSLLLAYAFKSPFRISKRYLTQKGEKDVYAYGETPLTTLDFISRSCQISKNDVVFELGCGRGRTCFWLNSWIGCRVVGIEHIPDFVSMAKAIKERFQVQDVEFLQEDILEADFTGATVFYIYGTCFDDDFIVKLADKIGALPPGIKVITVSYALAEYAPGHVFEILKRFPARFTWGEGDVFYQVKK